MHIELTEEEIKTAQNVQKFYRMFFEYLIYIYISTYTYTYIHILYRSVTRGGEGGRSPLPFFKIQRKVP